MTSHAHADRRDELRERLRAEDVAGAVVAPGSTTELEAGMVFSVEPGVYRDAFGVRLEDLVAVTPEGCERLNGSPRTWRPL